MYISSDHIASFYEIIPGLHNDYNTGFTVSFRLTKEGKYAVNENSSLNLKIPDGSADFNRCASFKIIPDKFFKVSRL